MKRLLVLLFILSLGVGCSSPSSPIAPTQTNNIQVIESNLDAAILEVGMVYGDDFRLDQLYWDDFIKTVECTKPFLSGEFVNYEIITNEFTPYFLWICYPQITKMSQTTIIAIEAIGANETYSGKMTILFTLRADTDKCLDIFGGTSGTRDNGW